MKVGAYAIDSRCTMADLPHTVFVSPETAVQVELLTPSRGGPDRAVLRQVSCGRKSSSCVGPKMKSACYHVESRLQHSHVGVIFRTSELLGSRFSAQLRRRRWPTRSIEVGSRPHGPTMSRVHVAWCHAQEPIFSFDQGRTRPSGRARAASRRGAGGGESAMEVEGPTFRRLPGPER